MAVQYDGWLFTHPLVIIVLDWLSCEWIWHVDPYAANCPWIWKIHPWSRPFDHDHFVTQNGLSVTFPNAPNHFCQKIWREKKKGGKRMAFSWFYACAGSKDWADPKRLALPTGLPKGGYPGMKSSESCLFVIVPYSARIKFFFNTWTTYFLLCV